MSERYDKLLLHWLREEIVQPASLTTSKMTGSKRVVKKWPIEMTKLITRFIPKPDLEIFVRLEWVYSGHVTIHCDYCESIKSVKTKIANRIGTDASRIFLHSAFRKRKFVPKSECVCKLNR